jgi:hypothetical protein
MSPRIKTQMNVLTRPAIVMRSLPEAYKAWCEHCLDVVLSLTLEAAANVLQTPSRTLFALLKSGELHVVEVNAKLPLICCNSISINPTETEILIQGDAQARVRSQAHAFRRG